MGFQFQAVEANMGSMLIGVIVSAVLLGVCLTQTFYYYMKYPRDPWYYHWLVATIALFDTIHLVMITHTMWHYLIANFNNPAELERLVWSIVVEALFTGVTGALVQCFYVDRVWRMSNKSIILTSTILFLVLANAGCGTVWVILAMRDKTYDELLAISPLTLTINALSTASDILIAGSLCFLLHRARTGFKRSDSMINKLIVFVVNTGVLTSICAVGAFLSMIISPNTLIYASFYFCIGRLYTNAFLATLNARKSLTPTTSDNSHMLVSMPTTLDGGNSMSQKGSQGISIRIDTIKEDYPDSKGPGDKMLSEKGNVDDESDENGARHTRPQSMDKAGFAV